MKLWGGRFKNDTHTLVETYNASIHFDQTLAPFDIQGSLAHVKMLEKCNLLDKATAATLQDGLKSLRTKLQAGALAFTTADEDVHMNIERLLTEAIGDVAGKLHTGRSRNDQVALDLHLYLRYHLLHIIEKLIAFNEVILALAQTHLNVIMPGYTHLQRAEPVRFSHHMMAYFHMFARDIGRLQTNFDTVNINPLGAGALAGSGVPVDPDYVALLLNFESSYENSLDAVSNRDHVATFLFNASLIMMHLSKMSEEIILWCSQEFSFITLDDAFCTGSSMMPQKKNPDVAELARGKVGRVYGALLGMLTVLKGLPLAYNKDLQEDKEGLFDTVKTLTQTLEVYAPMLATMQLQEKNMAKAVHADYANATQLANYLVGKEIAFREAHTITGKIVLFAIATNKALGDLKLPEFQQFCQAIENDVYPHLTPENVVESHQSKGGTAKNAVMAQLEQGQAKLSHMKKWVAIKRKIISNEVI